MTVDNRAICMREQLTLSPTEIIFFSKNQQPAIWEGMSSTKFCEDYGSIDWLMKWRTFTNRSEINKQIIFFFHQQQAIFITISQDRPECRFIELPSSTKPKSNLAKNLNDLDILGKGAALNFRQFPSIVISLKSRQSSYYIVFCGVFLDRFLNEDKFLDVD